MMFTPEANITMSKTDWEALYQSGDTRWDKCVHRPASWIFWRRTRLCR